MADNVYEMMAKIGLDATALMAGLALIGIKLKATTAQVEYMGVALKGLGSALVVVGIVKAFEDIAKAGGAVNHQLEMMKTIGMTTSETLASNAQANLTAFEVPTTHLSENLKHLQEIRYIMGDSNTANKYLSDLSRINDVISNIDGRNKDSIFDLAKSLEMKNLTPDPKEFMAYANAMEQVIKASGGKITAQQFRSAIQYGRVAAQGWDKSFIEGPLGRMVQEYSAGGGGGAGGGSGGPGNALMSMSAALIQGKMTKTSAAVWEELGFNNPRYVGIDKEHGRDLMMSNPYEWVQKYLMPALSAKGITDNNAIISKISELFGVRTAAGIVANMALGGSAHVPGVNAEGKPNSPFEKDIGLNKLAMEGQPAYGELIKNDYPMIMKAFTAEWTHFMEVFGSEMMKPGGVVITSMAGLVSAFSSLNKFFTDNPKAIDALLIALAGIGAAFAALAVTALITVMSMLAPGGLIIVAIAGLVAAFSALAALNWDKIKAVASVIDYIGNIKIVPDWMMPHNWVAPPTPQKQSFYGSGPTGPSIIPANFNPGEKKQILQPIQMQLNVDGRLLAQAVTEAIEDLTQHPVGSASSNHWTSFAGADGQTTST